MLKQEYAPNFAVIPILFERCGSVGEDVKDIALGEPSRSAGTGSLAGSDPPDFTVLERDVPFPPRIHENEVP